MDSIKRKRGRPPKSQTREEGRELLLGAVRGLLRRDPELASQRFEVAQAAGVSPALLCYYFPNHRELIEIAARPVVDEYMRRLLTILSASGADDAKLRAIVLLLIHTNTRDPHIVDCYIDLVGRDPAGASRVADLLEGYNALIAFLSSAHFSSFRISADPVFLIFALWGMCRSVAQGAKLPVSRQAVEDSLEESRLVDLVLGLVCKSG